MTDELSEWLMACFVNDEDADDESMLSLCYGISDGFSGCEWGRRGVDVDDALFEPQSIIATTAAAAAAAAAAASTASLAW